MKEPAAANNHHPGFANERPSESASPPGGRRKSGSKAGEKEIIWIGPAFRLWPEEQADMPNEASPDSNTIELIFAPAAAALEIIREPGMQNGHPLANAGYDPAEPRVPAGQPGGGQWTSAGGADATHRKLIWDLPPPRPVVSGGNNWGPVEDTLDSSSPYSSAEYLGNVAKVWEGYGDAITETACGIWNAGRHPINTAEGVAHLVRHPCDTLKAIGQQIAEDFTSGDPRKAGKLVGLVLINLATGAAAAEAAPLLRNLTAEKWAALVQKVQEAAAGKAVVFTAEEAGLVKEVMSGGESLAKTEIPTIGGRRPINSRYAGGMHPAGVEFTTQGFPKLGPHSVAEVKLEGLAGNFAKDSAMANAAVGLDSTPEGYAWHHVEDGKTMQLVPREIHNTVRHTGGRAVIRNGGFDLK